MEHFQGTSLVGCGLLLLTMGITPGALLGQTTERTPERTSQQSTNSSAPAASSTSAPTPTTPVVPGLPDEVGCWRLVLPLEQIGNAVRSIGSTIDRAEIDRAVQQELRESLAGLNERVRQEVEMSSPEMQRLQNLSVQLRANQGQFEESASELATRAAELAERALE